MKKLLIGSILVLVIGCQEPDSGKNPAPLPDNRCQQYSEEILKYSNLSQKAIVRMMVINSNQINVIGLTKCLDQTLDLRCQGDLCNLRKK
jgi:hypothetical protein